MNNMNSLWSHCVVQLRIYMYSSGLIHYTSGFRWQNSNLWCFDIENKAIEFIQGVFSYTDCTRIFVYYRYFIQDNYDDEVKL